MKRETKSNTAGQELTSQTKQGQEQENPYMGTWGRETQDTGTQDWQIRYYLCLEIFGKCYLCYNIIYIYASLSVIIYTTSSCLLK